MRSVLTSALALCVGLLLGSSPLFGDPHAQEASPLSSVSSLSPEYEAALHAVLELAAEYSAKTEQDLLVIPEAVPIESQSQPAIRIPGADGVVDEIVLYLKIGQIQNVTRTHQDGGVTYVNFSLSGTISWAQVRDESGGKRVKFWFDADGGNFPRLVVGMTSPTDYQGDLAYWEGPGNVSRIVEIERPLNYLEFIDKVCDFLTPAELDQAGFGYQLRFLNSAAYQNVEYRIIRALEIVLFRADRFRALTPEPAAVAAAVNGSNPIQTAVEPFIEFEVLSPAPAKGHWRFQFDPGSKRLVRAKNEVRTSAVFFDPGAGYTFFGAAIPFTPPPLSTDHVPGFWLFGFHPARMTPRLLVSCEGASFDAFSVAGHVCLWSPEGKVLFEKKDAAAATLAGLLREIDAALTPEEKEAVAWRGMDELPYLIGTY